ncbi:hypothetical protein OE88DRAFT_631743 [Heliocybe sulcata]|uniref:F-box domain-containing protein n=1 Tax=Heliocybe sulcata TaxID=5364 RepID=A0A5C3NGD6_9AGAM|nr:hypothetical protein OE88DRAFT_631743 [Heliocybe sulcata]
MLRPPRTRHGFPRRISFIGDDMHKCLTIAEVLTHILEHIPASGDLASIATVCHAFSECALEILWRETCLGKLVVHTIPASLLNISEVRKRGVWATTVECIVRPPRPEDMGRLLHYASFVRSLEIRDIYPVGSYRDTAQLDSSICGVLTSLQRTQRAFPRLRSLTSTRLPDWIHEHMNIFLAPSVRKLKLGIFASSVHTWLSLLAQIQHSCPHLEDLQMGDWPGSQELLRRTYEFIPSFKHMRRLEYTQTVPDTTIFHLLAELDALENLSFKLSLCGRYRRLIGPTLENHNAGWFRSLKTLNVYSPKLSYIESLLSMVTFAPLEQLRFSYPARGSDEKPLDKYLAFPSLRAFNLTIGRLDLAGPLFAHMSLPRLEELSIEYNERTDLLGELVSAISTACSRTSLKRLRLQHVRGDSSEDLSIPIGSVLRPLFPFRRIERMRLSSRRPFKMSNKIVEEFALSWPDLKDIDLGMYSSRLASTVTFKGLVSLASHCPNLELISLPMNVTSVPTIKALGYKDARRNHNVKELDFRRSPIPAKRVKKIKSLLLQIFPALQRIHSSERRILELAGR